MGRFGADSTCPCTCNSPQFIGADCENKCQKEGKVTALGFTDQFGCLRCKCNCPPYHNNTCQTQCTQEDKIHVTGARSRFGCDICQCGCLNRDCDTECGDLEPRVTKGGQGCIVGCQCICADDCEPNCHGCISGNNLHPFRYYFMHQTKSMLQYHAIPCGCVGWFHGLQRPPWTETPTWTEIPPAR